ncbi:caspase family protein [Parasphingorhabdus sp.]|uniref:caspase family protein n=1 Tax=Parasphingorhabdus sp. TaxID=2709688 RepID=UPI003299DF64
MAAFFLVGLPLDVVAANPQGLDREKSATPILKIETGMHLGMIPRIGVDDTCQHILTGSIDKTIRLWSVSHVQEERILTLKKTIHLPVDPKAPTSNEGKVYSVALSPNGKLAAAGGWLTGNSQNFWAMYVFDIQTKKPVYFFDKLPSRLLHLTFSPDGKYLAGTLNENGGVFIWKTTNWSVIRKDLEYEEETNGASFNYTSNALYTVSFDGFLRKYQATDNWQHVEKIPLTSGHKPYHVAFNSKYDLIAIGYVDSQLVDVLDIPSFQKRASIPIVGLKGNVGRVAWSSDGENLFAGGKHRKGKNFAIKFWSWRSPNNSRDIVAGSEIISHLLPCRDGVAFGTRGQEFGVLLPFSSPTILDNSAIPNMKNKRYGHFGVSWDGRQISFGLADRSRKPVIFDIDAEQLFSKKVDRAGFYQAELDQLPVENWEDNRWGSSDPPSLGQKKLGRQQCPADRENDGQRCLSDRDDERARSLAISRFNKSEFVIGSEWRIRKYNALDVSDPIWVKPIPSEALAVNITPDGRLLVAAYSDGTIRWHRMVDGEEILALFVDANDRRWIVWTPRGYFMSSINGEDLVGWLINDGLGQPANFYEAFRFRDKFYRPDIIRHILATLDIDQAIQLADAGSGTKTSESKILEFIPPSVSITAPPEGLQVSTESTKIEFEIKSYDKNPITDIVVLVNDIKNNAGREAMHYNINRGKASVFISHPRKDSSITIIPYSGRQRGIADTVFTKWVGANKILDLRPRLFGLMIGFSGYEKQKLLWGAKDAEDLKVALYNNHSQENLIYRGDPQLRVLTDTNSPVDRLDILKALRKLKSEVGLQNAVTIISYSGHGFVGRNGRFFLQSRDALPSEDLEDISLSQEDFYSALAEIPGVKILFIDACRAGDVAMALHRNIAGFMNSIRTGPGMSLFAFASTDSGELSEECTGLGIENGCFTASLLKAINNAEASNLILANDITSTEELRIFARQQTADLTDYSQIPVMIKSAIRLRNRELIAH